MARIRVFPRRPPSPSRRTAASDCHIDDIPKEVLLYIFKYLRYGDLWRVSLVCKAWSELFKEYISSNQWNTLILDLSRVTLDGMRAKPFWKRIHLLGPKTVVFDLDPDRCVGIVDLCTRNYDLIMKSVTALYMTGASVDNVEIILENMPWLKVFHLNSLVGRVFSRRTDRKELEKRDTCLFYDWDNIAQALPMLEDLKLGSKERRVCRPRYSFPKDHKTLGDLPNLKKLALTGFHSIKDDHLEFLEKLDHLESLSLGKFANNCSYLNLTPKCLQGLTSLTLSHAHCRCRRNTCNCLVPALERLPSLESLSLLQCMVPEVLNKALRKMKLLKHLQIWPYLDRFIGLPEGKSDISRWYSSNSSYTRNIAGIYVSLFIGLSDLRTADLGILGNWFIKFRNPFRYFYKDDDNHYCRRGNQTSDESAHSEDDFYSEDSYSRNRTEDEIDVKDDIDESKDEEDDRTDDSSSDINDLEGMPLMIKGQRRFKGMSLSTSGLRQVEGKLLKTRNRLRQRQLLKTRKRLRRREGRRLKTNKRLRRIDGKSMDTSKGLKDEDSWETISEYYDEDDMDMKMGSDEYEEENAGKVFENESKENEMENYKKEDKEGTKLFDRVEGMGELNEICNKEEKMKMEMQKKILEEQIRNMVKGDVVDDLEMLEKSENEEDKVKETDKEAMRETLEASNDQNDRTMNVLEEKSGYVTSEVFVDVEMLEKKGGEIMKEMWNEGQIAKEAMLEALDPSNEQRDRTVKTQEECDYTGEQNTEQSIEEPTEDCTDHRERTKTQGLDKELSGVHVGDERLDLGLTLLEHEHEHYLNNNDKSEGTSRGYEEQEKEKYEKNFCKEEKEDDNKDLIYEKEQKGERKDDTRVEEKGDKRTIEANEEMEVIDNREDGPKEGEVQEEEGGEERKDEEIEREVGDEEDDEKGEDDGNGEDAESEEDEGSEAEETNGIRRADENNNENDNNSSEDDGMKSLTEEAFFDLVRRKLMLSLPNTDLTLNDLNISEGLEAYGVEEAIDLEYSTKYSYCAAAKECGCKRRDFGIEREAVAGVLD